MTAAWPIEECCWPRERVAECVAAVLREAGLADGSNLPLIAAETAAETIKRQARQLGCEAERLEASYAEFESRLAEALPVVLELGAGGFLGLVSARGRSVRIVAPRGALRRVPLRAVGRALRTAAGGSNRAAYETLVRESVLARDKQAAVVEALLAEQIGERKVEGCWSLAASPGVAPALWWRQVRVRRALAALLAAHLFEYLLLVAAWALLGRASLGGRTADPKVMAGWALLVVALIPMRLVSSWSGGRLAVRVGEQVKRRLLFGALQLEPEEIRHQGIGGFLGQALEAEAFETSALSGGIAGLLAFLELCVAALLLGIAAWLLLAWMLVAAALARQFFTAQRRWTAERMRITGDLIESMVGQRTRLAQQPPEEWHRGENESLAAYFDAARAMDACAARLAGIVPRGWLLAGVAALAVTIGRAGWPEARIGIFLGGMLLAYGAFKKLAGSMAEIGTAWSAWEQIGPLFRAAMRKGKDTSAPAVFAADGNASAPVVEAESLGFAYRADGAPVIHEGNLAIRRGERVLLEGASGGGKSTLACLLAGLREPTAGRLQLHGVDRRSVGSEQWCKRVAAAPQFHENHVLTETLAFNVLLGRGWPPDARDMAEAEAICRELGLGELIDRMPAGMMQMVGEGGWQLSHGERSRVYVARAILQKPDLTILDESFGALDPENLKDALECTLRHAETLLVIAHP